MKIFFSVGEPSGDLHGANLIRELRRQHPGVECVGYGGPRMAAAGCQLHFDLTKLAVMWLLRVLLNIHKFYGLLRQADRYFREQRPDAVVLIDYPGFNWWIARKAKAHGIPVFYYGVPQLWAWASWRVKKMRRFVDHVLCKLPFEAEWYRERQCHATFVGHPYFDELRQRELDPRFLQELARGPGPVVTLLPGSRTQEVLNNLPAFLLAAKRIRERIPNARFAVASFNDKQAEIARQQVAAHGGMADVFVGRTPELIEAATCCLACSGSVSLELMYHRKPTVVHYKLGRLMYHVAQRLITVKYMTLVNLLADENRFDVSDRQPFDPHAPGADRIPFPEYPTFRDVSGRMAEHVIEWLTDETKLQAKVRQLDELVKQLGHGGASRTAAEYILRTLLPAEIAKAA